MPYEIRTRARELLQIAVLKTNPVFPFSRLNRAPYWLALNRFEHLCERFPEIQGVYVRHGITQSGWVPGISDIDLTVCYARGRAAEEEYRFISSFRQSAAELRRIFPMLADVEVLDGELLPSLTRFGIRSLGVADWKVLAGSPPVVSPSRTGNGRDRLEDAVCRYFEYLLPWYTAPETYLGCQRMARVASRILRYAPADLRETPASTPAEPALLVTRVLLALEKWILREEPREWNGAGADGESVLCREEICLLVLGPERDDASVRRAIIRHRNNFPGKQVRVVTGRLLNYWLREWQPRQYYDWREYAELLNGPDVLAQIAPPEEKAHLTSLLNMTHQVLTFPQREDVLLQARREWFAAEAFRWMAIRGWYLRLYLETGFYSTAFEEVMEHAQHCYPDAFRELQSIRQAGSAGGAPMDELRFRAFRLLKETAEAVHRALPAGAATEVCTVRAVGA